MMRVRIHFVKTDAMRFTGHLDLYRSWERTLRRAKIPLAYSQGFNPHPKINIAAALPLGFTGQDELMDIWLENSTPVEEITQALQRAVPPGIQVQQVEQINDQAPNLQKAVEAAEYVITFLDPFPDLESRVVELLGKTSLIRERREKTYDLRPLIIDLRPIEPDYPQRARLVAILAVKENGVGRPEEVAAALGYPPLAINAHRTRLIFTSTGVSG